MVDEQFWNDLFWGESQHTQFLENYRDQWVAIREQKVVAHGEDLAKVEQEARLKTGCKEIPVVFVESGKYIYVQS